MESSIVRIVYRDATLRRLAEDPSYEPPQWHPELVKNCRKKIQMLVAAKDERDLWAVRSLRLEKLKGARSGTYSIRLNDQYRLILALESEGNDRVVVVLEMIDYHH